LRFWRESSLIIPKNYDAPRRHGIPLPCCQARPDSAIVWRALSVHVTRPSDGAHRSFLL